MSFNKRFINNSRLKDVEKICKLYDIPYTKKRIFRFNESIKPIFIYILETDKFVLIEKAYINSDCDMDDVKVSELIDKIKLYEYIKNNKPFIITVLTKAIGDDIKYKKINLLKYIRQPAV